MQICGVLAPIEQVNNNNNNNDNIHCGERLLDDYARI